MRLFMTAGLDVGSSGVRAVVAEAAGRAGIRVLAAGAVTSAGVRRGVVTDMEAASDAIGRALAEAEAAAGVRIGSVRTCVSGDHLKGIESSGAVGIGRRRITPRDRERVVALAGTVYIPLDREVLHLLPTAFGVDGAGDITDPVGMTGVRLDAKVHIITAGSAPVRNLAHCCRTAGVKVDSISAQAVASGRSVLTGEELEAGVVLVDIGGGTTDIALFRGGRLRHMSVLGVGGDHITNDIAIGTGLPVAEAERIKKMSGLDLCEDEFEGKVEVPDGEGGCLLIPRKLLRRIIQARCEEIIEMVMAEAGGYPGWPPAGGMVLTGGTSLLAGFRRLAAGMTGMAVRTGGPAVIGGRSAACGPEYSAAVGLAMDTGGRRQAPAQAAATAGILAGRIRDHILGIARLGGLLHSYRKEGGIVCSKSRR